MNDRAAEVEPIRGKISEECPKCGYTWPTYRAWTRCPKCRTEFIRKEIEPTDDRAAQVWDDVKEAENNSYHANFPPSTEKIKRAGVVVIATTLAQAKREGVEAMLRAALDAYYDVDNEKDPDIVMRENADKLIAGLKEKK